MNIARGIIEHGGMVENPVLPSFFTGTQEPDHYGGRVPGLKITHGCMEAN